jgi:hypothetical protein
MDKVAGTLLVWRTDESNEVVISHPDLKPDAEGVSHIVVSSRYARHLAHLLLKHAAAAEAEIEAAGKPRITRSSRREPRG